MFDLDQLVGNYIESEDGWPALTRSDTRDDWDSEMLHVSDLTKCHRQTGMRLMGEKPEPFPPQKIRQFWAANQQHELIYAALRAAGVLEAQEVRVPLPDGWSGTADMILNSFHDRVSGVVPLFHVADSKNPHPNTVRYYKEYPKYDDIVQVSAYARHLCEPDFSEEGEIFYMPLGGSGRYKPCRFDLLPMETIQGLMAMAEVARDSLPLLADPLPLEVRWPRKGEPFSNKRMYGSGASGDIVLGVNWQCTYCRFSCPNGTQHAVKLASVKKSGITFTSRGNQMLDHLESFLEEDAR